MKKILGLLLISLVASVSFATTNIQVSVDNNTGRTVDRYSYNFGSVWINSMSTAAYTLTNTGDTQMDFSEAWVSGSYFDAYHTCTGTLYPGQKCRFEIRYWPMFEGYHTGRFVMSFNPQDLHLVVDLWGQAVR